MKYYFVLIFYVLCLSFSETPKKINGKKKEKKVYEVGPCHEPMDPLIIKAKKEGMLSIPLLSLFKYRKLVKECKKTGHRKMIREINQIDYKRAYRDSKTMTGWTSNHAMCATIVIFYFYIGLVTANK